MGFKSFFESELELGQCSRDLGTGAFATISLKVDLLETDKFAVVG